MMINHNNTGYIDIHSTLAIGEIAGLRAYFLLVAHHHILQEKTPLFRTKDLKNMVLSNGHEWPSSLGVALAELTQQGLVSQVDRGVYVLTEEGCEEVECILKVYTRAIEVGHAAFGPKSTNRRSWS